MANTAELVEGLKKSYDETRTLFEGDFKKLVARIETEEKKTGEASGLTKEVQAKMEATFAKYDDLWQKQKAHEEKVLAEQKMLQDTILEMKRLPGGGRDRDGREIPAELARYYSETKSFATYLRKGEERMGDVEKKALATDLDTAGGFLITPNMSTTMIELNVLYSPLRTVADILTISSGDTLQIPKEGSTAFSAQWVNERAARTETTEGTFAMVTIPTHELEANPWATQKMIDDPAINIESYIARKLGQQFGKAEGLAFISGSGVGQPQGISLGGGATFNVTTSDAFTATQLINFQYQLEEPYASNATWLSKRANFGQIRTLTAATDNFLWQPGLSAGEPPTLLGRPYLACNDITLLDGTATSSTQCIYFGDWRSAYKIVDRLGVRVLRDPFTNKPNVEFTTYKRVGGQVVLPEAYKIGVAS